ncbi:unnamed protein product [Mytilus coruscus]|uniref:Reverse transcriptase domain-containing protein n=1 Tax=Mytilus coruscus TaxID=42192 RepID=A0A6J8AGZ9_MYTCO|nr:unnamed protein product [Mytilus coruscus]
MLLRKVHFTDVNPATWILIDEIHKNTEACVKWANDTSEKFPVQQGVKQGGSLGCTIGETSVNAIACVDDVALMSENPAELQLLINIAAEYSQNHHYLLQPQKSVVLQIEPNNRKKQSKSVNLTLNESPMPVVDKSPHLGILRSTSSKNSQNETTEQNITKSKRAAYSLMSAGMHGENGLDPITSLHLIKTFIQPILTYGLDVILPTSSNLLKLEKFQKQLLKRIMSLPICTPDPSIYILSGFLPIEAQIDQKALILFNDICRQDDSNLEKKVAIRQLSIKDQSSNSWFISIKKMVFKYGLPSPLQLLNCAPKKVQWKRTVQIAIYKYWKEAIISSGKSYASLRHLYIDAYNPGKYHHLLDINTTNDPTRETTRLAIKLILVTGTYILQNKRFKYTENETPICKLCDQGDETLCHFLLDCQILEPIRRKYFHQIDELLQLISEEKFTTLSCHDKIQIILD